MLLHFEQKNKPKISFRICLYFTTFFEHGKKLIFYRQTDHSFWTSPFSDLIQKTWLEIPKIGNKFEKYNNPRYWLPRNFTSDKNFKYRLFVKATLLLFLIWKVVSLIKLRVVMVVATSSSTCTIPNLLPTTPSITFIRISKSSTVDIQSFPKVPLELNLMFILNQCKITTPMIFQNDFYDHFQKIRVQTLPKIQPSEKFRKTSRVMKTLSRYHKMFH